MKIKAAIIGMGIGAKHLEAIDGYLGSEVKIICEKDKKKWKFLKNKYPNKILLEDFRDIYKYPEINLISIASYDDDHFKQIMLSIRKSINLIIEKPMCLTMKELKKIEELLKNKKIFFTSNLVLRVNDLFKKFKKIIKNNKVFYIEADYIWGRKKKLFEWRSKVKNYSITSGAMIHVIDLINWLLESKPSHIYSIGSDKITRNTIFKKKSLVVTLLEYPKNIIVKLTANSVASHSHFHDIKIFTNKFTLQNNIHGQFKIINKKVKKIKGNYPDKNNRKKLIRNFIDNIIDAKIKPIISEKDQIDLMKICFAIDKSVKSKRRIKINYD